MMDITAPDIDLDEMLDGVVMETQLAGGRDPSLVAAAFGSSRAIAAARAGTRDGWQGRRSSTADRWTPEERQFLADYAGILGDEEIAARLGRSRHAIHVQRIRRGLPGPVVHPDYITGHQMARALGVDGHMVVDLIERGILKAEVAPLSDRHVWRMKRSAFVAWAVNPMHWPYFWRSVRDPRRMGDEGLRRLVAWRRERWLGPDGRPDEWLTPGEVAALHGVHHTDVNRYVQAGRLQGVKWGNWLIRRSEATRPGLRFFKGKGATQLHLHGTPDGDAFLILAAAVGVPYAQIARMLERTGHASVQLRLGAMHRRGHIAWLIRAYGLPVLYRAEDAPGRLFDGALWADWRTVAHRFPRLARAWARWEAGEPWGRAEMGDHNLVNGALRAAVVWNLGDSAEGRRLAHGLTYRVKAAEEEARGLWYQWAAAAEFPPQITSEVKGNGAMPVV